MSEFILPISIQWYRHFIKQSGKQFKVKNHLLTKYILC